MTFLPIPLKYNIKRYMEEGIIVGEDYIVTKCPICKNWYAIPKTDTTNYTYYCASNSCLEKIDEEAIRYEAKHEMIRQAFKNVGMENDLMEVSGYVPLSYSLPRECIEPSLEALLDPDEIKRSTPSDDN